MQISKIQIKNFRSLRSLEVDLEEYLSLVVGKNNSGKTSFLLALERFLSGANNVRFEIDDFNTELQKHLSELIEGKVQPAEPYPMIGISLRVFIEYRADDDLANVGNKVIMDLDPDNHVIVLDFLYHLAPENLAAIKRDFEVHKNKKGAKAKTALDYLREEHRRYFKFARRSVQFDHVAEVVLEESYVDLIKENIRIDDIISFKRINARRSVSNKDSDRGLSTMSAKIYKAMSEDADEDEVLDTFKEALTDTDTQLNSIYASLFKEVIDDVRQFGGIKEGDTQIEIKSTLQGKDMLEENTTVMYGQGMEATILPETHNGLGYLNLISIIFEIKILLNEFKRSGASRPADINLLFIEEPEAHTHPQMQAIFIKNIKNLIGRSISNTNGIRRPLQTILSTHSSHIVSESDFDDIKYFQKTENQVRSKNLKHLKKLYQDSGNPGYYKFLKQYLTLNRSELFFADKAILVEGDTERILLPAMMRKIDQLDARDAWVKGNPPPLALLSQNISVIEVGAHSHIYEIFLDFIGVKTLIITDIDSAKEENQIQDSGKAKKVKNAHAIDGATHTQNYALQFYHGKGPEIEHYLELTLAQKTVLKDPTTGKWSAHADGQVMCIFQISEKDENDKNYHARSFEDAFFHVNRKFISTATKDDGAEGKTGFPSLVGKHLRTYLDNDGSSFAMAKDGITKKPSFAIEILLNSETTVENVANPEGAKKDFTFEFSNWKTPRYIEEGLTWIKEG